MPHIILEHSSNIEIENLLETLHDTLASTPTIEKSRIKSRVYKTGNFLVGQESDTAFIALTIKILPNRSKEEKNEIIESLRTPICNFVKKSGIPTSFSIELIDLTENYFTKNKTPLEK